MSAAQVSLRSNQDIVSTSNPLPVTMAGGGGGATSENQLEMIGYLDDILAEIQSDTANKTLTVRLDEVSDTLFYVGKAVVGSVDANAVWQIVRYTQTGVILKSEYANGAEAFNQIWNDRTTLTYI
jgi:hypothetical protein